METLGLFGNIESATDQMTSATIDHAPGLTLCLFQNQIKRQSWMHQHIKEGHTLYLLNHAGLPGPCRVSGQAPNRSRTKSYEKLA